MAKRSNKNKPKNRSDNAADPHADRESRNYENPIASRELILELIKEAGALSRPQLIKELNIKGQESREALRRRLRAMERDNQILFRKHDESFYIPEKQSLLQGIVEAHRDGYGFLLLDGQEDIYLSEREMRQVFHGDEVLVRPAGRSRRGGVEGKIDSVVKRANEYLVGRLARESDLYFVVPDNPRIGQDILLPKGIHSLEVEPGDYVSVKIITYPTQRTPAEGVIDEVLGSALAPGLEIDLAIRSHDLPYRWSDAVIAEAGKLGDEPEESDKQHRVDLRDLPLVTIDGEDARDFDDAVYCKARKGGGFTLWVAIADVSHYVPVGSALDQQAYERSTSVYFPGRVVPMLPEAISNGLCSLKPDVDRLCMVSEIDISARGKVTRHQFYEAVMHSHARLTYNEVAEALGLTEKSPRAGLMKRLQGLMPELENLNSLYQCLRAERSKRGAIDFETTETKIIFNADRKIETIAPVFRNDAHKIIEECMLCANVAAANFLASQEKPVLYRVHEGPKEQKLDNLRLYLGELGLSLSGGLKPSPNDYQVLMQAIEGRPDAHLIQIMMLRSLSQAVYQPDNEGHFGLAYPAYLHFTSPIRRYPDLLVHRAIRSVIRSRKNDDQVRKVPGTKPIAKKHIYPYEMTDIVAAGIHTSMAERRADDATRDVTAWLKCEYLQDRIGESFAGVISGVTRFGLFVELKDLYVEGLVHINNLGNDFFHFDQAQQRLLGERTRKVYRLGDAIEVVVARVDLDERKVDLEINAVAKRGGVKKASAKKGADKNTAGRKGSGKKADPTKNKTDQKDKKKNGGKKRKAKALAKAGSKRKPTGGKSSDGRSSDDKPNNGKSKKPAVIAKPLKKNKVKKTQEKNKSDHTTAKPVKPVRKQSKATAKNKKSRP